MAEITFKSLACVSVQMSQEMAFGDEPLRTIVTRVFLDLEMVHSSHVSFEVAGFCESFIAVLKRAKELLLLSSLSLNVFKVYTN